MKTGWWWSGVLVLLGTSLVAGLSQTGPSGHQPRGGAAACRAGTGGLPAGLVGVMPPASPALVSLGRDLFDDPRLSADGSVSCASCHRRALAFTDGQPVAVGIGGTTGERNTPTIFNLAFRPDSPTSPGFLWDGRAASVGDAIQMALTNPKEMGLRPEQVSEALAADAGRFMAATGGPPSLESVVGAVTAFVLTLTAGNSAVDRYLYCDEPSALSPEERRGLELFAGRANCVRCHVFEHAAVHPLGGRRAPFTDGRFHNIGAGRDDDRGRGSVTGQPDDDGAFRTPTLRNVARTAPYMHDGSLATLEDVVDFYNRGGGGGPRLDRNIVPLHLDADERRALVAFLRALDTEEFRPTPWHDVATARPARRDAR